MDRRTFLAGTAVLTGGCLGLGATGDYDIGMALTAFDPDEITVDAGATVVWKNTSSRGHTVTAFEEGIPEDAEYFASGGFESEAAARDAWQDTEGGILFGDETFEYTFEVPGRYDYVCLPHERSSMLGTVRVEE